MTDGHYDGYQEMLSKVAWDKYGVVDGKARDPRCEHCMVHCGYDPSGALGTNYKSGDNWKNFKYNFWPRPKPYPASEDLTRRAVQRRDHRQRTFGAGEGHHQFTGGEMRAGRFRIAGIRKLTWPAIVGRTKRKVLSARNN